MQAKRIQVNEQNLGAGGQVNTNLTVPDDPREMVNFHNIWSSMSVEPQNAGANCQGTWIIWKFPKNHAGVIFTDAAINLEESNQYIVACGVFSASNEMPWNSGPIQVKTSRNLNPGDILRTSCIVTGISAGLASIRVMGCAHTIRA